MNRLPFLAFADSKGKIYARPHLRMAGFGPRELIKLPAGSTAFILPGRRPVGFNPKLNRVEVLKEFDGKPVWAVAAFLPPAYLRLRLPAYLVEKNIRLPLWAYTACGFYSGSFYASAIRIDPRVRQSPRFYNPKEVKRAVGEFFKHYPENRLYAHLANCALNYNCLAAKNLFLKRWEAPLPTAQACNARCLGCLSYQAKGCASHQRINFTPSAEEIVCVAANHLKVAREAIVSFGQGCEGEPLTEAKVIGEAVNKIRATTKRGTINVNTNGSLPEKVEQLCRAGVDSFRVSLNSPREEFYNAYFRPVNYKLNDVLKSIAIAKKYKKFVSINFFVFPGVSDTREELAALVRLIKTTGVDMIQWRNLNIDPDFYLQSLPGNLSKPLGILNMIQAINRQFPALKHGYFNLH